MIPAGQDRNRPVVTRAVQTEDDVDDVGRMIEVVVVPARLAVSGHEVGEGTEPVSRVGTCRIERGTPPVVWHVHVESLAAPAGRRSSDRRSARLPAMSEVCDTCGFTADDYSARDLRTSPGWLAEMAEDMTAGVDPGALAHPSVAQLVTGLRVTIESIDPEIPDASAIHDAVHGLRELGRALHQIGAGISSQQGTVTQISASDGGVPKAAVATVDIGLRGLIGDRQANRKHHGRPFQALCLWSTEVIDALVAEGHPIAPGLAGENLTLSGIDWASIRPGARLLIGEVTCEISCWAEPCRKNDPWFNGRSDRMDHRLHPGWSRAYAWVIEPGSIATGDPVIVEP